MIIAGQLRSSDAVDLDSHDREPLLAVPERLLARRTVLFCFRMLLAGAIIAGATALMLSGSPVLFAVGLVIQGAMYVHLIEFQHSVLHRQVFESNRVSRIVGFTLGLPMMISYSDFQYKHLRHHRYLGTPNNSETFTYSRDQLNSLMGFMQAMLDYSRLNSLMTRIYRSFNRQEILSPVDRNAVMETRISEEYRLFGLCLIFALTFSILLNDFRLLMVWLAPLVVSEPVHFLLELPEHLGLPAHSNPNVFENTRSWGGSWFARWFTHYTNFHVAHHYNQLVPMDNLPELQKSIDGHIPDGSRCASYPDFYKKVIRGEIVP